MPKQITAPQIIIELEEDPEISDFLSYQKKSTQHTYTSYFRRLKEFYDVTGKRPEISRDCDSGCNSALILRVCWACTEKVSKIIQDISQVSIFKLFF